MKEAINYLNAFLKKNDTVILGISGGPDSMCLLSLIMQIPNIKIVVAHINHNVRKESQEEYKYLENYCKENNLIFEGYTIKEKIVTNFESEARKIRYAFFNKLMIKYDANYIMTAHHADDLMETILMRISRGSNLHGYIGIKKNDGIFIRPLLNYTKDEIIEYLNEKGIKYFVDRTNDEDIQTRNRYRHHVIPFLKNEDKDVHKKFIKYSNELLEYETFVNKYIAALNIINYNQVDLTKLKLEDLFIQRKIIEIVIKNIQKDDILNVSDKNMIDILNIISSDKPNQKISLNNGYIVHKKYDQLIIKKDSQIPPKKLELFNEYYEDDLFIIKEIKEINNNSNFVTRVNTDEIKMPLYIRFREPGDIMNIKHSGNKKIKDIFIDNKIDIDERKMWPIVVDSDNTIIWLPGIKKSKFDKEKNEKYDIILASERKNVNE